MTPMDEAWFILKASRQMKLYNYIEDYPGMVPVSAYRGVPFLSTQPRDISTHSQKRNNPIDMNTMGTFWTERGTNEPHATASNFGVMGAVAHHRRQGEDYRPALSRVRVLGHRGPLESSGRVQRRTGVWNPTNDAFLDEAILSHNEPLDLENLVVSLPSESETAGMTGDDYENWVIEQQRLRPGSYTDMEPDLLLEDN